MTTYGSMDTNLDEKISLSLSKAACLVLFDLLTTAYEGWRKENPDDSSAEPMEIKAAKHAQRFAIWKLEGVIESTMPEVFAPNYLELVKSSERLMGRI